MPKRAYILVKEARGSTLAEACSLTSRLRSVNKRIGTFEEAEWALAEMHAQFPRERYNIYTIIPITRVMLEPLDALTPPPTEQPDRGRPTSSARPIPPPSPELLEQLTQEARRQQGQDRTEQTGNSEDLPF